MEVQACHYCKQEFLYSIFQSCKSSLRPILVPCLRWFSDSFYIIPEKCNAYPFPTFCVVFQLIRKEVPRLSLLFDDEDERRFHERVQACHELREEARAIRRYTAFVDSQVRINFIQCF